MSDEYATSTVTSPSGRSSSSSSVSWAGPWPVETTARTGTCSPPSGPGEPSHYPLRRRRPVAHRPARDHRAGWETGRVPPPRGAAAPDDRRGLASEAGLTTAARRILGNGPRWRPPEVWERAGVPESLARRLWLAMGFPHLPDGEPLLTDHDLQALRRAGELLVQGALDADHLVHQARLMAQAVSTVATAHVESLLAPGGGDALLTGLTGDSTDPVALVSELLEYLYRRHLYAALERAVLTNRGDEALAATAVGFADLSDFSARSAAATEDELTVMIDAFVTAAADLVAAHGGRVVKLLGDAVLFTVGDARAAAEVALDLAADHRA
ncbi:hypothetical protein GHK86_09835, partial [Acidimicrobiaceae bacterium USS-CC1]|nr:hypothetical protein [Acidiferrimicrobium australe]